MKLESKWRADGVRKEAVYLLSKSKIDKENVGGGVDYGGAGVEPGLPLAEAAKISARAAQVQASAPKEWYAHSELGY